MFSPATIASVTSEFVGILEPEVDQIASLAGASAPLVAQVTAGLDGLKTSAAALATAEGAEGAAPLAQRIVADGEAVLNALTALPLPPQLAIPVRIASMVFGFLPGIVALLFPPQAPAQVAVPGSPLAPPPAAA